MKYQVNDISIEYHAEGDRHWGEEMVMLDKAIDLTAGKPWHDRGYTIAKLFPGGLQQQFEKQTYELLRRCWRQSNVQFPAALPLDQYHRIFVTWEQHLAAVEHTKLISTKDFPIAISLLEDRISEICKTPLQVLNPYDGQSVFHFRVIRPNSRDNNPLHRDVWLEDYDDCINLYIPVTGSDERSSLILIPGSHRWNESQIEKTVSGARINGVRFNVPAVTDIRGPYEIVRAVPKQGEVLVFSPYLIHGGAINLNPSTTRISLEIRLWKR